MPLTLKNIKIEPDVFDLAEWDVTISVKRSTLADEGERFTRLFSNNETALMTDIAMVEMWLTIDGCNILGEDEEPLFVSGMPFEQFAAVMTSIWQYDPNLFWAMHNRVRTVNSHWAPIEDEEEGNAPTA